MSTTPPKETANNSLLMLTLPCCKACENIAQISPSLMNPLFSITY